MRFYTIFVQNKHEYLPNVYQNGNIKSASNHHLE